METGVESPAIVIEPVESPVPAERKPAPAEPAEIPAAPVEEPIPA